MRNGNNRHNSLCHFTHKLQRVLGVADGCVCVLSVLTKEERGKLEKTVGVEGENQGE